MKIQLIIPLLFIFQIGCNSNSLNQSETNPIGYKVFIKKDSSFSFQNIEFSGNKDSDLNIMFSIEESEKKFIIEKGKFDFGQKVNNWKYNYLIKDSLYSIEVNWIKNYFDEINMVIPNNWRCVESNSSINFHIDTDSQSIMSIRKTKTLNFDTFLRQNLNCRIATNKFKDVGIFKITQSNAKVYYSIYTFKNGKDVSLELLSLNRDTVYQIELITVGKNEYPYDLLFFEIIRNLIIDGKKIFPYITGEQKKETIYWKTILDG